MSELDLPMLWQVSDDMWIDPSRVVALNQTYTAKPWVVIWVEGMPQAVVVPGTVAQLLDRLIQMQEALLRN